MKVSSFVSNQGAENVMCVCLYQKSVCKVYRTQGELNRRRGRKGFRTHCCEGFGLLKN